MIKVLQKAFNKILEDSIKSYPDECCGVLIGRCQPQADEKNVVDVRKVENINKERAKDRYEIDPKEVLMVEKDVRGHGLDIVGFYHSHPNQPARPSVYDKERAWPEYSYIIVSIRNGAIVGAKSWTFSDPKEEFKEEELVVGE